MGQLLWNCAEECRHTSLGHRFGWALSLDLEIAFPLAILLDRDPVF
jgi:hypothetical protein